MTWTELHAQIIATAFEKVLDKPQNGHVAFARCLTPEVTEFLAGNAAFEPAGWRVCRVANVTDLLTRTISADHAVELRERKEAAILLLVDIDRAGAGMDGIYSAALEVNESSLFSQALHLAKSHLSSATRRAAEQAISKARRFGHRFTVPPWTEFDFLVRIAAESKQPGELLYLLGLWPVKPDRTRTLTASLDVSRMFVERLLGTTVAGITPSQRIIALRLDNDLTTEGQLVDLERFLQFAATRPVLSALAELSEKPHLWVNALPIEEQGETILNVELVSWRTNSGRIAKWSGLVDGDQDEAPALVLNPEASRTREYSKLEVRWKSRPDNLAKGAAEYHVAILTDMDEELASLEVAHTDRKEQKCRFTNDDFSMLNDDALISARVVVSVVGHDEIEPQESEEFAIRFGAVPGNQPVGIGKKVRTLSEGVIELGERKSVSAIVAAPDNLPIDSKSFVLVRTPERSKSFRVFYPPLLQQVERNWVESGGTIGRWRVRVRASGARASVPEFVSMAYPELGGSANQALWERVITASRRMAERFAAVTGVGQIYDDKSKVFETIVKNYLLAWAALLEEEDPSLALANTIEVQTLSGKTIGLIVLPSHPLRVAWHVAYDNLVLHTAFVCNAPANEIRDSFSMLDGAMFPAFLPGVTNGSSFVFADMLGFHTVAMVPDYDQEPKAAVAILARALGESETADTSPTVGKQSAQVLGNEILKYLDCHYTSRLLHIHALRPGDGYTVARALGSALGGFQQQAEIGEDIDESEEHKSALAFVLELYSSPEQHGLAGRYLTEVREKRRSGAGVLASEDRWMLESLSLPGGINLPRLRWARKSGPVPDTAAHIAIAFDTFESRVAADLPSRLPERARPLFAYGLLSFFEREYTSRPSPQWHSAVISTMDGEKHPSDRTHTERLVRIHQAVERCLLRSLGSDNARVTLRTEISPEKAEGLRKLHQRCDWVITLDRNAGVEYFDSPRDNKAIYDIYVIDTVPEREDLGCLQLITSTSNLAEVRNLLDTALDQMGLSRSRRNAEFLMEHLKALSGRLAIRLTGQRAATSELIALALSHANCRHACKGDACWAPLNTGFLIPVDDVRDLIPALAARDVNSDLSEGNARPDLIYVSVVPRRGLSFQFIEVKYRRHLRVSRSLDVLQGIHRQVQSLRQRWDKWYSNDNVNSIFRAVRRAKLARVLRFYADKAHRHYLPRDQYESIVSEINRMIEKGGEYSFAVSDHADCGWVFCPEHAGVAPMEISPGGSEVQIFLFGPGLLPDWSLRREDVTASRLSEQKLELVTSELVLDVAPGTSTPDAIERLSNVATNLTASGNDARLMRPIGVGPGSEPLVEATSSVQPPGASNHQVSVHLGTDLFAGSEVHWPLTTKGNPHLLIAGLPGMGKTTCLLNMCRQMLSCGVRPIVFSYHEDIDEKLEEVVGPLRFIDFNGLGFNPLEVVDRQAPMGYLDIAGALRDIFLAIYPELGDIQGERIRQAIKGSFIEQGWNDTSLAPAKLVEPGFERFVEILRTASKPDQGLRTLLARLEELADYGFFTIVDSPYSLWEGEQPTVVRIHTTQNDNLQKAFASLVFYKLYKDMFRRGIQQQITHAVVFDEAHRAARLRLIPTMARECRKYGISLALASQGVKDFNPALFSAIANYLVLRLTEADAKALVRNVATSDQERMLVDKIKQMERFKALYFCEGRKKPSIISLPP
jgi:DNA phosphorothioation-dependent restriction protein DptH